MKWKRHVWIIEQIYVGGEWKAAQWKPLKLCRETRKEARKLVDQLAKLTPLTRVYRVVEYVPKVTE